MYIYIYIYTNNILKTLDKVIIAIYNYLDPGQGNYK